MVVMVADPIMVAVRIRVMLSLPCLLPHPGLMLKPRLLPAILLIPLPSIVVTRSVHNHRLGEPNCTPTANCCASAFAGAASAIAPASKPTVTPFAIIDFTLVSFITTS